jgi:hypothetical protein
VAVPRGVEAWVRRLLAKEPTARFAFAADAAADLRRLGGAVEPAELFERDPQAMSRTTLHSMQTRAEVIPVESHPAVHTAFEPRSVPLSPVWGPVGRPEGTVSVGLGLFGIREPTLVGRAAERGALWDALGSALRERRGRLVRLTGTSGYGKTRLAHWIARSAHELGAALCMGATHAPVAGRHDGIDGMCRRFFQVDQEGGEALVRIVKTVLGRWGRPSKRLVANVCALLGGAASPPQTAAALLRYLARNRGVVVVLDDVQWGLGAIELAARVRASASPILVVMTHRPESTSPEVARRIEALGGSEVTVGPLAASDHTRLVRQMLGFRGEVASAIAQRTGGSPLFAQQLVGDWVHRGVLRAGPTGFEPVGDVRLPENLAAVWHDRVDAALDSHGEEGWRALGVAAVLGTEVDRAEWLGATRHLGLADPLPALDRMIRHGLLLPRAGGPFAFSHSMLRDAVLARMDPAAWRAAHAAVAEQLCGCIRPEDRFRRGNHRLNAGREREGLDDLLSVVLGGGWLPELWTLRGVCLDLEHRLGCVGDEENRAAVRVQRAQVELNLGHEAEGLALIVELEPVLRERAWWRLCAALVCTHAQHLSVAGPLEPAIDRVRAALEVAQRGAPEMVPDLLRTLGAFLLQHGDLGEALAVFERGVQAALERAETSGAQAVWAELWRAYALRLQGRLDEAQQVVDQCRTQAMQQWRSRLQWYCEAGEVARARGDLETAEACHLTVYRDRDEGQTDSQICTLNLLLVGLTRGDVDHMLPADPRWRGGRPG